MDYNNVVIDIDGVLADFEKSFCQKFGNRNRHKVKLEMRYPSMYELIKLFVDLASTYEVLDIVPVGIDIARWCKTQGFIVHIVSSRPDYTYEVTARWLQKNNIPYDHLSVDKTSKFDRIVDINPLFIVDDLLEVCIETSRIGIPSFLVDWPWNRTDNLPKLVSRINDFQGFLANFGEINVEREHIS